MEEPCLPPNVDGRVRGHLRLHVPFILWLSDNESLSNNFQVHVSFWGQRNVTILTPLCPGSRNGPLPNLRTVIKYDVCCSFKRFNHYLNDMNFLDLFVYHKENVLGSCRVGELQYLDLRTPVAGLFAIMNHDLSQKLGELFVSLSLTSCGRSRCSSKLRKSDCRCSDQSGSDSHSSSKNSNQRREYHLGNLVDNKQSLKKSLNMILERAITLRNKGYFPMNFERLSSHDHVEWNLGKLVNEVFQDDSSPDESLLDALILPKNNAKNQTFVEKVTSNRSRQKLFLKDDQYREHRSSMFDDDAAGEGRLVDLYNLKSAVVDQLHSGKIDETVLLEPIKDVESALVQEPINTSDYTNHNLKPSSCRQGLPNLNVSTTSVDLPGTENPLEIDDSKMYPLEPRQKNQNQIKPNPVKMGLNRKKSKLDNRHDSIQILKSDNSQSEKQAATRPAMYGSSGDIDGNDLRLLVASLHLNDHGLKLLGRSRCDWIFRLEIRMPVIKGGGHGVWDYRGHRVTSDLQVTHFTSCIYNRGVVFFNQEKGFENVNRSQNMMVRLEAKNSATQRRRSLGSCILPLRDISDATVILPISTVQPNGQLSFSITALTLTASPNDAPFVGHADKGDAVISLPSHLQNEKRVTFSSRKLNTAVDKQDRKIPTVSFNTKYASLKRDNSLNSNDNGNVRNQLLVEYEPYPIDYSTKTRDIRLPTFPDFDPIDVGDIRLDDKLGQTFDRSAVKNSVVCNDISSHVMEYSEQSLIDRHQIPLDESLRNEAVMEDLDLTKDKEYARTLKKGGCEVMTEHLVEYEKELEELDLSEDSGHVVTECNKRMIQNNEMLRSDETNPAAFHNSSMDMESLHSKSWTISIEQAVNLPTDVTNTFVTCDYKGTIGITTNVSKNHVWNHCVDVNFDPCLLKSLNLKLFKCEDHQPLSDSVKLGESTVDVRCLRWLSFLSGWYLLLSGDSVVGQIKVGVWPSKTSLINIQNEIIGQSKVSLKNEKTWINWREEADDLVQTLESLRGSGRPRKLSVVENLKRNLEKRKDI